MSKLEHLVNAIARLNGLLDPEAVCYKLKNPLMLRSYALPGKHETDESGVRVFQSVLNGYKAAMFDIELKASGKSRANAGPNCTLEHFLRCYDIKTSAAVDNIVSFLRRAMHTQEISKNTLMSYFLESGEETCQMDS
jgi:hypothetical protein